MSRMRNVLVPRVQVAPVVIRFLALARTDRPSSSWCAPEPCRPIALLLEQWTAVEGLVLQQVWTIEDRIGRTHDKNAPTLTLLRVVLVVALRWATLPECCEDLGDVDRQVITSEQAKGCAYGPGG